ncbi:MAG: U32 family peptidase [Microcoleaceae cyanobacterium]
MKFNTFVQSFSDLEQCINAPNLSEILLEPIQLTRQGTLTQAQIESLAKAALEQGLNPILVWDILTPETQLNSLTQGLMQWDLSPFSAIRVCDPGVAWWVKTHLPNLPIQFIVETGNHNLEALLGWCEIFGDSLNRLILSIELPEDKLVEYCQTLPVNCELLGVGPILLFYSPRSLLSSQISRDENQQQIQATITSEESGNRLFPTLETPQGTFMFLDKDQFILDQLDALEAAGLHTIRIDLRHLNPEEKKIVNIEKICQQALTNPAILRKQWPRVTRAPFFKTNRTTSIFSRMKSKSKLAEYRNQNAVAEILTGESGNYVVFYSWRSFNISQVHRLILPTGQEITIPEDTIFRNIDQEEIKTCEPEQILITSWIKKAMPGSLLLTHAE